MCLILSYSYFKEIIRVEKTVLTRANFSCLNVVVVVVMVDELESCTGYNDRVNDVRN